MLTKRQKQALDFITQELREKGVSPTYAEIGEHMGLRSKASVHKLVHGLEERGFVTILPGRARAIAPVGFGPVAPDREYLAIRVLKIARGDKTSMTQRLKQIEAECVRFIVGATE